MCLFVYTYRTHLSTHTSIALFHVLVYFGEAVAVIIYIVPLPGEYRDIQPRFPHERLNRYSYLSRFHRR